MGMIYLNWKEKQKEIKEIKQKIEDETPLTKEQSKELIEDFHKLENKYFTQREEIKELKKRRSELLDRMRVIQELQGLRPVIVRAFDEFVRMVPDGIYIEEVTKKGDQLSLTGITESANRVSTFMRNLEASDWFQSPNLNTVTAKPELGEQAAKFSMTVNAAIPKTDDKEEK